MSQIIIFQLFLMSSVFLDITIYDFTNYYCITNFDAMCLNYITVLDVTNDYFSTLSDFKCLY